MLHFTNSISIKCIRLVNEHGLGESSYWSSRARTYMAKYHEKVKDQGNHGVKKNISAGMIYLDIFGCAVYHSSGAPLEFNYIDSL